MFQEIQETVSAGELAVEAHFVPHDISAESLIGNEGSADMIGIAVIDGLLCGRVGFFTTHAFKDRSQLVIRANFAIDMGKVAVDAGGFGDDGSSRAPEAGGNLANEVLLELSFGFQFLKK